MLFILKLKLNDMYKVELSSLIDFNWNALAITKKVGKIVSNVEAFFNIEQHEQGISKKHVPGRSAHPFT